MEFKSSFALIELFYVYKTNGSSFLKQALQSGLFLGLVNLGWNNAQLSSICLSGAAILQRHEFDRIFRAALTHGSDMHLYFNMVIMKTYCYH